MVAIRPSTTSSTVMPHGVQPTPSSAGRYCANAGEPFASTGSSREPAQPQPAPCHHSPSSTTPCTHIWNGGMFSTASSCSSRFRPSMSKASNACT